MDDGIGYTSFSIDINRNALSGLTDLIYTHSVTSCAGYRTHLIRLMLYFWLESQSLLTAAVDGLQYCRIMLFLIYLFILCLHKSELKAFFF